MFLAPAVSALAAEEAFLAAPTEMPIIIDGRSSGKMTLPIGAPVQVLERRGGRVRIRARMGNELWISENGITAESAPAVQVAPSLKAEPSGSKWEWAIKPRYDDATRFGSSGFAWVKRQGKWFLLDRQGREILQTPFERVAAFSEHGCATGEIGRGSERNVGLVGPDGKLVLKPEWEEVGELIRGFVPVKRDEKWGYADASGKLVIPCEWNDAWRFSPVGTAIVTRDGKRGFIDAKGKLLVEPVWDGAINHAAEGIGAVRRGEGWALIDRNGKLLCEPEWQMRWAQQRFDLGWIPVWKTEGGRDKIGLLGKDGELLVATEWDGLLPADGGVFLYKTDGEGIFVAVGGKVIFTAPQGVVGIPEARVGFFDGLAMVSDAGETDGFQRGFIDEQGKLAVPFRPGEFLPFSEGLAAHRVEGKWGFVDRAGNDAVPHEWDEVRSYSEKHAAVCRAGRWGFIDASGKVIAAPEWDAAGDYIEGLASVAKEINGRNVWTFLTLDGSEAFTVDPKIRPTLFEDREERVSAAAAEFPRFRKGYLKAYADGVIRFDNAGRIVSRYPISDSSLFLAGLPTPFARRYPEWDGFRRKYDYGGGRHLDLVDRDGKIVLPGVSSDLDFASELIPYPGIPAYGWIDDATGKVIAPPAFDYVRQLSDDLILVRKDGKFGVSTRTGQPVLAVEWDSISIEGHGLLATRNEKNELFTAEGRRIEFPSALPGCEYVDFYGPDFMFRQPDGKYSLCSTATGEFVTFADAAKVYWNGNQAKAGLLWVQEAATGRWSLVRRDGTPLGFFEKEQPRDWMHHSSFGLVRDAEGQAFFIDSNGKPLGSERWDDARPFQNGFAAVNRKGQGWGYIGEDGQVKISPDWDFASSFENVGTEAAPKLVANVSRQVDGQSKGRRASIWGIIDASGKTLLEPQSDTPVRVYSDRGESVASIRKDNQYERIPIDLGEESQETAAPAEIVRNYGNNTVELVDATGRTLIPADWESIVPVGRGLFLCWYESTGALLDREGQAVFRDTRDTRLVRLDKRSSAPEFSHPVIFVERPPAWGYVKRKD